MGIPLFRATDHWVWDKGQHPQLEFNIPGRVWGKLTYCFSRVSLLVLLHLLNWSNIQNKVCLEIQKIGHNRNLRAHWWFWKIYFSLLNQALKKSVVRNIFFLFACVILPRKFSDSSLVPYCLVPVLSTFVYIYVCCLCTYKRILDFVWDHCFL